MGPLGHPETCPLHIGDQFILKVFPEGHRGSKLQFVKETKVYFLKTRDGMFERNRSDMGSFSLYLIAE
jgi:hypothetical protein